MPDVALVTGASSGIGEQFARQLAERGSDLVLVARRADRLEGLAAELPTRTHAIPCDLETDAPSLPARVAELGLDVDLLVNSAGFGAYGRFIDIPEDRDAEQVRVNCEAIVTLTRAFLPGMVARGRGGVINMGSISGMQPLPYTATYSASKAFVRTFTDGLHAELRGTGVRALCVNPGAVPTEWQAVAGEQRTTGPKISAERVVREALDAYEAGKRTLIPGRAVRMLMGASRLVPRPIQLRVTERAFRPRSR
jgi:short-subunit dehydrogenase